MATAPSTDDDEQTDDIPDTMRAILDELHNGDRTRGALADAIGRDPNTVGNHLAIAEARGYVSKVHDPTSLWTLDDDPRGYDD